MANGDVNDDDPTMGQDPSGGGAPPAAGGQPPGGGAPPGGAPGGPPQPGGILAAMARGNQGPQISAPGPGNQADSMNLLQQAIGLIQQAAMGLQPGSPLHRDALQSASRLSRHLGGAAGMAPGAGIQKTQLGDQLRRTVQQMMLQRIMAQKGQGGGAPGGKPPAPMPSTPLPGS
jgi:hypothetical protein